MRLSIAIILLIYKYKRRVINYIDNRFTGSKINPIVYIGFIDISTIKKLSRFFFRVFL